MQADFEIDIHAFYSGSLLWLDSTHLPSLEVSICDCEYRPPLPRKVRAGGNRPRPLHDLHPGQMEGLLSGSAAGLADPLDATARQPAQESAPDWNGVVLSANYCE